MLRAEPAEFFLFLSFTCDILGYVIANYAKLIIFTFYVYFPGHLGHDVLRAMMGPPLDTPLCGAKRERKLNERERSGVGAGAVSGGYRIRRERKFRLLPFRSHAMD